MRFFTIHERPAQAGGDTDLLAVKTGFSWWAAVFPPLWLLRHRLWLGLAAYVAFSIVFGLALELGDVADTAASAIGLAVSLLIGAMAHDYRRWSLGRQGWRMVGVLRADSAGEAELAHYAGRPRVAAAPLAAAVAAPAMMPMRGTADAFPRLLS
jgi:hypothetical protein